MKMAAHRVAFAARTSKPGMDYVQACMRLISIVCALAMIGCGLQSSRNASEQLRYIDLSSSHTQEVAPGKYRLRDSELHGPSDVARVLAGNGRFSGTRFLVKGIVQLRNKDLESGFPEMIEIPINGEAKSISILHGTCFWAADDVPIAVLRLKYQNQKTAVIPIRYGKHVRDWFQSKDDPAPEQKTDIAWTARNPTGHRRSDRLRIYRTIYDNPIPTEKIESIEYESTLSACSPFLFAVTLGL
jgi:hypothetical protein